MCLCTVASEIRNDTICKFLHLLRKDTVVIRHDVRVS